MQSEELQIQNRTKAQSFRAQIRNQLIKGLFHENYELKTPISPLAEEQIASSLREREFSEPEIKITHAKSKCFDEVYEVEKTLGQGMHAVVKKARNNLTGERVAVKIIRSGDPEIIRTVMREFQNVSILDDPNIIKPLDLYINKITEHIHYVMEYVSYKSLSHILQKHGPISESNVIRILRKLLPTVSHMHGQGVCHRDITPKNILMSDDFSELKLIDFGVSKQFAHFSYRNGVHFRISMKMFTVTGMMQYMAPEIHKGEGYTISVDLWSIGILVYELLSADIPFKSVYLAETLELVLKGSLNFPEKQWNSISPLAKDFIRRLLKSDPKLRLTAKEALNHPWLFLEGSKKKKEKKENISFLINKKKPSILTIALLRDRIPSIDDIDCLDYKSKKHNKVSKFKEKMSVRGLDLHVHTIENRQEFRNFSPRLRIKSGIAKFQLKRDVENNLLTNENSEPEEIKEES